MTVKLKIAFVTFLAPRPMNAISYAPRFPSSLRTIPGARPHSRGTKPPRFLETHPQFPGPPLQKIHQGFAAAIAAFPCKYSCLRQGETAGFIPAVTDDLRKRGKRAAVAFLHFHPEGPPSAARPPHRARRRAFAVHVALGEETKSGRPSAPESLPQAPNCRPVAREHQMVASHGELGEFVLIRPGPDFGVPVQLRHAACPRRVTSNHWLVLPLSFCPHAFPGCRQRFNTV